MIIDAAEAVWFSIYGITMDDVGVITRHTRLTRNKVTRVIELADGIKRSHQVTPTAPHRFRPCERCGRPPDAHNTNRVADYIGHEYV